MTFTIGQVSDLKEISTYTLRYYDKQGLLPCSYTENPDRFISRA
ncbi:MerR family DNA-binding transcriptional regulator [Leuconostoc suionicum]|nr:MerR family DNA-binding transcriptional regulator [Leuconostoc suionicum]